MRRFFTKGKKVYKITSEREERQNEINNDPRLTLHSKWSDEDREKANWLLNGKPISKLTETELKKQQKGFDLRDKFDKEGHRNNKTYMDFYGNHYIGKSKTDSKAIALPPPDQDNCVFGRCKKCGKVKCNCRDKC